jgi:hypothetical protein
MQGGSRDRGPRDLRGEAKNDTSSVGMERDPAGSIDVAGLRALGLTRPEVSVRSYGTEGFLRS